MDTLMFWQNIHHFDQQLTLTINSWNSAITDPFWTFMSMKLVWIPLYLGIIAMIVWKLGWKKALFVVLGVGLTIGFCDQFSNLIKNSVCRIRPLNDEWMVAQGLNILEWGGGYSFFSAHAANSFGIAGCTWLGLKLSMKPSKATCTTRCRCLSDENIVKTYGWIIFSWAALVAISRIFGGRHSRGDVLVGTIVGIAGGLFFGWLSYKAISKFFSAE